MNSSQDGNGRSSDPTTGVCAVSKRRSILRDCSGVLSALAARTGCRLKTGNCARPITFLQPHSLGIFAHWFSRLHSAAESVLILVGLYGSMLNLNCIIQKAVVIGSFQLSRFAVWCVKLGLRTSVSINEAPSLGE